MNAAVRFLAGFCREHPLDDKVFVCPSPVVGREIGETLAREAGSWVNLRFATPWTLAGEVLERSGRGGVKRPMTSSAELALIDRLFRELCEAGALSYFIGPGRAPTPGLIRGLHRALRDLRLAGLAAADIRPGLFLVRTKGEEVALLLSRYERALDEAGLLDAAAFLAAAARAAAQAAFAPAWTLAPADVRLSRLERELVRAAAGDRLVLVPGDPVFGLSRPRQCWPAPAPAPGEEPGPMSRLFAPAARPAGRACPAIEIFRALGPANECREVLRRLYAEKVPFDQAEVLAPSGAPHPTIFHLLAARTRLPVTFGEGVPVSFTSPGRLYFGLLDWLENDFSSDRLGRLLENGDLALPPGPSGGSLAARTACRHLRSAMIGWGRDRYRPRLAALRETKRAALIAAEKGRGEDENGAGEARRASLAAAVGEIEALSAGLERLLRSIPEPAGEDGGRYDIAALCAALAEILEASGRADADIDRKARKALLDRLTEARGEGPAPALSLREALSLLRATGAALRVGASPPLSGHLHVAGFSTGGPSGRPVTFIVGLDEATFPGRGLQDPVLLDEERAALSEFLPTAADGLLANLFGLAAALASSRGRTVFSYPSFDLVEGRTSFPSSVVLQAYRLLKGDPGLDYAALDRDLPDPAGFFAGGPGRAFDEIDWWLERLAGPERVPDGPGSIPANFPDLAAGLAAAAARAGDALTAYDGLVDVGPVRADVDPLAGDGAVMSASRLERLAQCPFAYFLRHVLKVEAPEEVAFDRARWLDPLRRGRVVHEILCEFMTRVRDGKEAVSSARHAGLMEEVAGPVLARTREEVPPPSEAIFESEAEDIRDSLAIFLSAEENREEKGEPFAFELEIDRLRIGLGPGRSFLLRGSIDRVDRLGRDAYRVLDYKTGSPSDYEELVEFGGGRKIQHALYAVALETMLAARPGGGTPRVTRSGYVFPSRRGEGLERIIEDFDRDRLRALLGDLFGLLGAGRFIAAEDAGCGYCDYAPVCVAGGPKATQDKRTMLLQLRELMDDGCVIAGLGQGGGRIDLAAACDGDPERARARIEASLAALESFDKLGEYK